MDPTIIAVIVFVAVFSISALLLTRAAPDDAQRHKQHLLRSLDNPADQAGNDVTSILRGDTDRKLLNPVLLSFPGMEGIHTLMMKTGDNNPNLLMFLLRVLVVVVVLVLIAAHFQFNVLVLVPFMLIIAFASPIIVIVLALVCLIMAYMTAEPMIAFAPVIMLLSIMLPRKLLLRQVDNRNQQFLDVFPDAMDMIVRSVRAGHPLTASLRMIAENIDPPVSTEFKQVIDEISYGRTMPEALARMAQRIDQPDLNYFVVVLSVQQETGGNLSEVLSNLSDIIRKRKMLRLKIRALTAEARATGWVLGLMPIIVFGIIYYMSPDYIMPLLTKPLGNIILVAATGLVMLGAWIVYKMIQVKV